MDKSDTISKVYNDPAGFGSMSTTLKDARKRDKTITIGHVKEWFSKNVEKKQDTEVIIHSLPKRLTKNFRSIYVSLPNLT